MKMLLDKQGYVCVIGVLRLARRGGLAQDDKQGSTHLAGVGRLACGMSSAAQLKSRSTLLRLRSRTSAIEGALSAAGFVVASAVFSSAKTMAVIIKHNSRIRFFIAVPLSLNMFAFQSSLRDLWVL